MVKSSSGINGTEIEISDKYISFSKSHENKPFMQHAQNIKCILKDKHDEEQNEDKMREEKELKFKFAAIVLDKIFFYVASIYSIMTFIGLLFSI